MSRNGKSFFNWKAFFAYYSALNNIHSLLKRLSLLNGINAISMVDWPWRDFIILLCRFQYCLSSDMMISVTFYRYIFYIWVPLLPSIQKVSTANFYVLFRRESLEAINLEGIFLEIYIIYNLQELLVQHIHLNE